MIWRRVAGNDGGGVGIGAIQQHLNAGGPAALDIAREARQHADHAVHLVRSSSILHFALVRWASPR